MTYSSLLSLLSRATPTHIGGTTRETRQPAPTAPLPDAAFVKNISSLSNTARLITAPRSGFERLGPTTRSRQLRDNSEQLTTSKNAVLVTATSHFNTHHPISHTIAHSRVGGPISPTTLTLTKPSPSPTSCCPAYSGDEGRGNSPARHNHSSKVF